MGAASFFLTLLFLLPHLARTCSVEDFNCGNPDTNGSVKTCGRSKIRCQDGQVLFQFYSSGQWYPAGSIKYPERTMKIWDSDSSLLSRLPRPDCDFLYHFASPLKGHLPSSVEGLAAANGTFFNCTPDSYDFSRDVFGSWLRGPPRCDIYDLYYSSEAPAPLSGRGGRCSANKTGVFEMVLTFDEDGAGFIEFSLLSIGFSRHRALDAQCFGCSITGGQCSANASNGSPALCACSLNTPCPKERSGTRRKTLLIGFTVAGFVLLLASGAGFLLCRQRFKRLGSSVAYRFRSASSEQSSSVGKDPESDGSSYYQTPLFTYKELEEATKGFDPSTELGDGGFGTVYKGKLKDGRVVAVKRLYENNLRRMQQFRNEVEILNRLRHRHLVALYGCTRQDGPGLMLVYEYVPNGTVADHLHGPRAAERLLTWPLRMSVALETAEALAYLHAVRPPIVHRDVKTSNILLDADLHVKVGDFGLSRLFPALGATHVSTAPQGTPGYLDPEYHQCYHLTDKSDVYSFGVVLAELLTSMPAVDITRSRNEINLSSIALARIPQGRVAEVVDPGIGYGSDSEVRRAVGAVAEVAFRCLQAERDLRPTMEEVLGSLRAIAAGGGGVDGGPGGGMGVKALLQPKETDNSALRNNVSVDVEGGHKRGRDDAYLLDSPPFSPDSDDGAAEWPSRSTTPNASR